MSDKPQFIDNIGQPTTPVIRGERRQNTLTAPVNPINEDKKPSLLWRVFAGVDVYLLTVVGLLLAIGGMMVYSTTFDWGYQDFGTRTALLSRHMQTTGIAIVVMIVLSVLDYRMWRRFALWMLLGVIGALIAVLLFGDDTFNARRGLIGGRFQPGEAAQLVMVIYMAAWLSAKRTKVRSITYGLIPFATVVGLVGLLIFLQPDLSTTAIIAATAGLMYFLAGANLWHLSIAGLGVSAAGWFMVQRVAYAQARFVSYFEGIADLTQSNYHVQQAIIAFMNGGWLGVGLGAGRQKFGYLPAPHTDSIFASIGEELGVVGATFVVLLYVVFALRGFMISRRAVDTYGALLASGVTILLILQALLNIAVMTAVLPATGVPLPLISYGGSSMTSLLAGVGLMLSVSRVAARQAKQPERRTAIRANANRSGRNGGTRVPRTSRS